MEKLTLTEIVQFLDNNGELDEGAIAIKTTIKELIMLNAGTTCCGKSCFGKAIAFHDREVKGWYIQKDKEMVGMIHIQCTEKEAEILEIAIGIRSNGESLLNGFWEFEDE